jgi:hypothetical protein
MLLTPAGSTLALNQPSLTAVVPSLANRDAAFALLAGESLHDSGDFLSVADLLGTTAGALGGPNPLDTLTLVTPGSSPSIHSDGSAMGLQEGTLADEDSEVSAAAE